jgi:thioredoxin 2
LLPGTVLDLWRINPMSNAATDDKGVVVACAHCGKKNRVPYAKLGETGQCGHCQTALPPPSTPIDVGSEAQFDRLVNASPLPVVVDYWAPWCGPCRMVAPELEKVAASSAGMYLIAKVNTEALPGLGQRFQIQSIPTMGVFAHGQEVTRTSGARPAAAIHAFVQQAMAAR